MKATTTMYKIVLMAVCAMIALAGCQADSRDQLFATSTSQVQLRSFQTRAFDTTDSEKTLLVLDQRKKNKCASTTRYSWMGGFRETIRT